MNISLQTSGLLKRSSTTGSQDDPSRSIHLSSCPAPVRSSSLHPHPVCVDHHPGLLLESFPNNILLQFVISSTKQLHGQSSIQVSSYLAVETVLLLLPTKQQRPGTVSSSKKLISQLQLEASTPPTPPWC